MIFLTSSKLKDKIRFLFIQCRNNYYALHPLVQCPVQSTHTHTFSTKLYLFLTSTNLFNYYHVVPSSYTASTACTFSSYIFYSFVKLLVKILSFCAVQFYFSPSFHSMTSTFFEKISTTFLFH